MKRALEFAALLLLACLFTWGAWKWAMISKAEDAPVNPPTVQR